jgi:pterin-4a-carbinolamine dehydratase
MLGPNLLLFPSSRFTSALRNRAKTRTSQDSFFTQTSSRPFPHYTLFAKSCSKVEYYPEIFNVYNKVVVKCYTEKDGKKFITTKDLFMSFLLNELEGNQQNVAYSRAIDAFPVVKDE